jgi:hypothetical protein
MELASMQAGERFSDHPRAVSPTIACLLRWYNDLLDDERRQDLRQYAARIIGTADQPALEQLRVQRLNAWADQASARLPAHLCPHRRQRRRRENARRCDPESAVQRFIDSMCEPVGQTHSSVLALLDELIEPEPSDDEPAAPRDGQLSIGTPPRVAVGSRADD